MRVSYRVYAREMGVRSNYVDPEFALLNGAPTFLSLVESAARPHEVTIELPAGWTDVKTALPVVPGSAHTFRAPDFDTLVDSPIVLGTPAVYPFSVDGVRHELVNVGEGGVWDGPRSARDVEQIVRTETDVLGNDPVSRVPVPQPHQRGQRGHRAQGVHGPHDEPLADGIAKALSGVALDRGARVLPRVERQAAAAGGARAVRLRSRELHTQPVDRGRTDRLLRRPLRPPCQPRQRSASISMRFQMRSRNCRQRPGASCSRSSSRRSTRGSSSTGPMTTRTTCRWTTTRRVPSLAFCWTRRSAAPPAIAGASTT